MIGNKIVKTIQKGSEKVKEKKARNVCNSLIRRCCHKYYNHGSWIPIFTILHNAKEERKLEKKTAKSKVYPE